jgi:cation transport regulator ChaC
MSETYKIFAYGSLLHQGSLTRTVPEARNLVPAKVNGLKRVFNLASHYRFDERSQQAVCVLNVETTDPQTVMNGCCFEMDKKSLEQLLRRENGYEFCHIEARHFERPQETFNAYYFHAKNFQPYRYLSNSKAQQHYLDLCLQGSAIFGTEFVTAFKRSTSFWGIESKQHLDAVWNGEY